MTISIADIDRWDSGDVREVFHATRSRAEAAFEAADGIADLPAFGSWGGDASEAAKEAIGQTRKDLDAHGNEALAVAQAATKAADSIEQVKSNLARLRAEAESLGMTIDPVTNTIEPGPGSSGADPMEIELKRMQLQPQLDAILAEATSVDNDLARAIAMATGHEPIPDTPHDNRPEIQDALSKPVPEDPEQFNELWGQLTPEEKDWLYRQDHSIGNHPGMPFVDRNHYNRMHLTELTQSSQAEIDRLAQEHPGWARGAVPNPKDNIPTYRAWQDWKQQWDNAHRNLEGYHAVEGVLDRNDGVPRFLGLIDDQGHAAVSIGDPDTASHSATLVPGTGQDLAAFEGSDGKSLDMFRAALDADPSLTMNDVAVTTWMGYDRPMDLGQAAFPGRAETGGAALSTFIDGMHASHAGPPAIDTVIGHSYGSTLVGGAASGGNHLAVENVIGVGSPGMLAGHASDLNLDAGANVYATRAQHDIIHLVAGAALGPNPTWDGFGAVELEAAPGPSTGPPWLNLPSVAAHSSYWDEGNPALANMGAIIAGMPPPKVVP
ncbi:hypothetical protein AU198_20775 [Mycobacterium sp. GA-1199]|uniref:alpha/beta hydrolase n=1 Tax=Mycobacterium sp. GA-1199 TaxID=1772287 RepID=UPI00074AE8C6|nr:alpha/beta hydrolase [Mycobacterium sp. GA-1199]KUI48408.1 hypothetical protein AU198_20775 [Mycobacterium sp. GA-1199]